MPGINHSPDFREKLNRMAEMLPADASARTEARLLSAFRARRRTRRLWRYAASTAVCLVLGFGLFLTRHLDQTSQVKAPYDGYAAATAGFVALPYAESGVPMEDAVIVRLSLQPSELARLGVPVAPPNANGRIDADLLIGQDGVPRAVRLVD
jgi:hypothetical protein